MDFLLRENMLFVFVDCAVLKVETVVVVRNGVIVIF